MKKTLLLFTLFFGIIISKITAQIVPLPYYTGFDSTISSTSIYSWGQFADAEGNTSKYKWAIVPSASAPSSPNILQSPNAALTDSTFADTIAQWYVSPPLDIHGGEIIDSFSINVFAANCTAAPSDSILLYLIEGSNLPAVSYGQVLLANLTGMASCDHNFRDTGNFVIPNTIFPFSCIAFKYYGVHDSFQVSIDNIHISRHTTGLSNISNNTGNVLIFPNPANNYVQLALPDQPNTTGSIKLYNTVGTQVSKLDFNDLSKPLSINLSGFAAGIYYAEIWAGSNKYIRKITVCR
ncbi:MAG: T9SS type A sorting domain-containing protein [Flavipsychrobacter sp.]|nr:T9SS type A sorting domain-containing protein [Flavipsychrobacter sp.]